MRVAVVGSGISGLVTAYLLHADHDVTVFEGDDRIGGHTNTVSIERPTGTVAVDTGFIVFNEPNYPSFTRLLSRLGVVSQPTSMSFSVRCDRSGIEYNGTSVDALFCQRRNLVRPRFWGLIRDILRFGREAPALLDEASEDTTVADYLATAGYGAAFAELYLEPLGASLWSCAPRRFREFPVRFVAEFLRNHAMLQVSGRPSWRVVTGGSHRYVEALTRPFKDRIRTRFPVHAVRREPDAVTVRSRAGSERFDHVIFACHADQALALLGGGATPEEREILGCFPYQENEAVLHTDTSVLPRRKRAWAAWNYHRGAADGDRVTVTYDMNILQSLVSDEVFCVTLNDDDAIDPSRVIRRIRYEHPLYTRGRAAAQLRHRELIGPNRTSFCGAYWGYGFHEDGVRSAEAVCATFGRSLP